MTEGKTPGEIASKREPKHNHGRYGQCQSKSQHHFKLASIVGLALAILMLGHLLKSRFDSYAEGPAIEGYRAYRGLKCKTGGQRSLRGK